MKSKSQSLLNSIILISLFPFVCVFFMLPMSARVPIIAHIIKIFPYQKLPKLKAKEALVNLAKKAESSTSMTEYQKSVILSAISYRSKEFI